MKNQTRINLLLTVLLLLCVSFVCMAGTAMAAEDCAHVFADGQCTACGVTGGYCGAETNEGGEQSVTWTLADNHLVISGTGAMADYTSSNPPWADYCDSVTNLVIEDGVTAIGNAAFYECKYLTSVEMPDSVTSIGNFAFSKCAGLTSLDLPDNVTFIGSEAFYGCTGLTSLTIPASVTEMDKAFFGCSGLTDITISDGVTSIHGAFYRCTGLTSITIPNSVTSIGYAFYGCTGLESIVVPDSVTEMEHAFDGCTGLRSANIPSSVSSINGAFRGCTSLTSIEIPDSVTTIGNYAFTSCTSLTSIVIPDSVTTIGDSAFRGCTGLTSIDIPDSVTTIGNYAFGGCTGLTSIVIPDSVTTINDRVFSGCTGLESVAIPNSVTVIRSYAFEGCTQVSTVIISCTPNNAVDYCIDKNFRRAERIYVHAYENGVCTDCGEPCPGHTGGEATCTEKAVCTICGTSYGEVGGHTPDENGYTVSDGTHSYSCSGCGVTVTEPHTYDDEDGTCVCSAVKTYTVTFNRYGDSGAKIVEINGEAKEILPGETFTVPHGQELTVKFANTVSQKETGVYCDGYVVIDPDLIMCNYNEATNTLIIPGSQVTGDIDIFAAAYVRVQFNLHGGTLSEYGEGELEESFGFTWVADTSTLKATYGFSSNKLPDYFQLAGHTLAGVKVNGSDEVVQLLSIRSDMTVDILWQCDGTAILTPVPAKDATCTEAGNIAHYTCTCGKLYAEDETTVLTADEVKIDVNPDNHVGMDPATGMCVCGEFVAVAQVDDAYFTDFGTAITAWQVPEAVKLTLHANVETSARVVFTSDHGDTKVLDLNGCTWTNNAAQVLFYGNSSGMLTIQDSTNAGGAIVCGKSGTSVIFNDGTLNITGGTIAATDDYTNVIDNGGTAYISGNAVLKSTCQQASCISNSTLASNAVLTITGDAKIEAGNVAIGLSGTVDLSGAKCAGWVVKQNNSGSLLRLPDNHVLQMGDKLVTTLANGETGTIVEHKTHDYATPKFDNTHHWDECACGATTEKVEHTFTYTPVTGKEVHIVGCSGCTYTAPEEIPHEFTNGVCVCTAKAVAKVEFEGSTTYYATLGEALTAAKGKNATVTLLTDGEITALTEFYSPSDITLDLNGKTITASGALLVFGDKLTITGNGKYITDGKRGDVITVMNKGTLTIENGTFVDTSSYGVLLQVDGETNIRGGSFTTTGQYSAPISNGGNMMVTGDSTFAGNADRMEFSINGAGTLDLSGVTANMDGWRVDANGTTVTVGDELILPDGYALKVGENFVTTLATGEIGTIVAHTHNYTTEDYDATHHWTACACGATTEKVNHTFTYTPVTGKEVHIVGCSGCTYTAPEEIPHEFTNGVCVCTAKAVAKVEAGGTATCYTALETALGAAQSGSKVTLLASVELTSEVTIPSYVTFNGGEFTLSGQDLLNNGIITGGTFTATVINFTGDITGGTFDTISYVTGAVSGQISFKTLDINGFTPEIDLSHAVNIVGAMVGIITIDLPVSDLKLPDGCALEVAGEIVSTLLSAKTGTIVAHEHGYTYTDQGDGTHSGACPCGAIIAAEPHTFAQNDAGEWVCECKAKAVAKVGETYYTDFANAVAAWTDGTTLTLLADVTYDNAIEFYGGSYTFVGGNYTLDLGDDAISIYNGTLNKGALTIESGTIKTTEGGPLYVQHKASAKINSDNTTLIGSDRQIAVDGSNSLTITGNGCDGWWIWAGPFNGNVPITIPEGFHLEDTDGKQLDANDTLPAGKATVIKTNHTHSWSYTADDEKDTITAVCSGTIGTCPSAEQSITLNAPDVVYSGNPVEAEVTREGADLTYTLRYTGTDYDSPDAPVNAGDYTVTMTVGDKSVSASFTISPKDISVVQSIQFSLAQTSFVYSGEAPALNVTGVDSSVGSYTMQEGTDYSVGTVQVNAGSYKLTVTGMGNYTGSVELDYSIAAKPITITDAVVENVTFDPAGYTLTVKEVVFDGVIEGETLVMGENGDYAAVAELTSENAASDAATANVTVSLMNANYSLSETTVEATFQITQSGTEMTATADKTSYIYGETITVIGTVKATGTAPATTLTLRNAPAAQQVALFAADGTQLTDPVNVVDGAYTLIYNTADKGILPAASITLTVKFVGDEDMADAAANVSIALTEKQLTATNATATTRAYEPDNTTVSVTAVTISGVIGTDDVKVDATNLTGEISSANAGTYTTVALADLTLIGSDKAFYTISDATVTTSVEITPKEITNPTIVLDASSFVYDGTEKKPAVTAVKDGDDLIDATEYTVSYTNNIEMGTATVTLTDVAGGNYTVSGSTTFQITQSGTEMTATADKTSYTYGETITVTGTVKATGTAPAATLTLRSAPAAQQVALFAADGTQLTDPVNVVDGAYTLTYNTADKGILPAASITLTVKFVGDDNMADATANVSIALTEKQLTATNATATTRAYEPDNTTVSVTAVTISGVIGTDDVKVDATNLTGEISSANAGTYTTVALADLTLIGSDKAFYTISDATVTTSVEITPKEITNPTIVLDASSFVYDGTEKKPAVTSVKDGDDLIDATEYTVSYTNNIEMGTATVTLTDVAGGNYTVSGSTTFQITQSGTEMTATADKTSYIYGETITVTGTVKATGTAPATTLTLRSAPAAQQVALFAADGTQLTDPVNVVDGAYTLTYNTTDKGILPAASITLTVKFVGDEDMADAAANVSIALTEKQLTATNATATTRAYEPDNTTVSVTAVTISGVIGTDDVKVDATNLTGEISSSDAGTYTSVKLADLTLIGNDKAFYTISDATVTTSVEITPKEITNPTIVLDASSFVYDGTEKKPAVTAVKDGDDLIDATEYTVSYANNIEMGTATVTLTDVAGGNYTVSGSTTFQITQSGTEMTATADKTSYTYGETITVTGTVKATGTAPATTLTLRSAPAAQQVALFAADGTQLTDPVNVVDGAYTLTYNTADKGILPAASITLTVKFVGDDNMADQSAVVTVTLTAKSIEPVLSGSASKAYDGTTTVTDAGNLTINLNRIIAGDTVSATAAGYAYADETVGQRKTVTANGIALSGADSIFYTLAQTEASAQIGEIKKAMLIGLTEPADTTLDVYCADADAVIGKLPDTVVYHLADGKTVDLKVEWSCTAYDSTPGATNIFAWAINDSEKLACYEIAQNVADDGTVIVTNSAFLPVTVTGTDTAITYNGTAYDVTQMFAIDSNAGAAVFEIINGGTGEGTLNGSVLTITKAGTITIKVTTAPNAAYAAGEATAVLTISKGTPAVTLPTDLTAWYGQKLSDIVLPTVDGGAWSWTDMNSTVGNSGVQTHQAIFTPADTNLWNITTHPVNITVVQAGTSFGEMKVYNGNAETTTFTYGETITVKAEATAVQPAVFSLRSLIAPAKHQMALFIRTADGSEIQISEAVNEQNGVYTMTYNTTGKALSIGDNALIAKFVGDENMADYQETVLVTLNPKELTIASLTAQDRVYEPGNQQVAITGTEVSGKADANDDVSVLIDGMTATISSENVGTYDTALIPQDVSLTGNHAGYYFARGNVAVSIPQGVEITQATPYTTSGAPAQPVFDPIYQDGQTLGDIPVSLPAGTFNVPGTIEWEAPGDTPVTEGTPFTWVFTPDDPNWKPVSGTVVIYPDGEPPVITAPAGDQEVTVYEGEQGTMFITAADASSYQWYINRYDGLGYVPISGATSASYTTSVVNLGNDGFTYYCVASNAYGNAESPVFLLQVLEKIEVPETGDESNIALWTALAILSFAGLTIITMNGRRSKITR